MSDWVEKNFKKDVIRTVMREGVDHKTTGDDNEHQWMEHEWLDLKDLNVTVELDKSQISRMRYVCPQLSSVNTRNGHYEGLVEGRKATEELQDKWVEANFDAKFLKFLRLQAYSKGQRFVPLPPGASTDQSFQQPEVVVHPITGETSPQVRFRQTAGDNACVIATFCSCMFYLGWSKLSQDWWENKEDVTENFSNRWKVVLDLVRGMRNAEARRLAKDWTPLTYTGSKPVLMSLLGSDGKCDHVVAVCNGWIFDGNFDHAMPICQRNLDKCCSSEGSPASFEKCGKQVYMICEKKGCKKVMFPRES